MKGSQESLTTAVVKDAANWPTPNCMDVITPTRDLTNMESKGHWGKQPRNRPDGVGFIAPNTGKLSEMVKYGQAAPANPSTDGNRQELWLTPRANEPDSDPNFAARNADRGAHCHGTLSSQAKSEEFPTPRTTDWKSTANAPSNPQRVEDGTATLGEFVHAKQWGTPTARDHKSGRGNEEREYKELTPMVERTQAGKLNPRWVETLMGLPMGWVMPSCKSPVTIAPTNCDSSATESSPPPQPELF
jgi:hypothetical protein